MVNIQSLIQLKAFARIDGLWLALLWTVSFVCVLFVPNAPWGNLLMFATPILMAWRLILFRNHVLNGVISYRRALAYGLYMSFYASLLFGLVQVLYFRFLDNGRFIQLLIQASQTILNFYQQNGIDIKDTKQSIEMLMQVSPIELGFVFMMQNLVISGIISTFIALVGMKRRKTLF